MSGVLRFMSHASHSMCGCASCFRAYREDLLASSGAFCDLVAAARRWKFKGHWSGSAYRRHPCGVIEGSIKLTNHWSTFNYCSIEITDGDGWSTDYSRDPFGSGSPYPAPKEGFHSVMVWENGRWVSEEFRQALETEVRDLLGRIESHVASEKRKEREDRESEAEQARERSRGIELAALARCRGGGS